MAISKLPVIFYIYVRQGGVLLDKGELYVRQGGVLLDKGELYVRQGGVLSPYLFAVYLDDLPNELNNIKAGCYIGKVLLNHLMFADDICVMSKCTLVAKNTRCVPWRRMQNRMGSFSTATKLFVWHLRLKVQEAQPLSLEVGWSIRKFCWPIQISGDCIGYWALRWQRHSETTAISIASLFFPLL